MCTPKMIFVSSSIYSLSSKLKHILNLTYFKKDTNFSIINGQEQVKLIVMKLHPLIILQKMERDFELGRE